MFCTVEFFIALIFVSAKASALQCSHCHTPKYLKIPGDINKYAQVMEGGLHTGIMSMDKDVLTAPKNNFPDWENFPKCNNMTVKNCTDGQVCGYNEMHHKYFARTCVWMNETLYKNATVNKCYVHGMRMHKTTFLYCDTDLCNHDEISAAAAQKCIQRVWVMAGMEDSFNLGDTSATEASDDTSAAAGLLATWQTGEVATCLLTTVVSLLMLLISSREHS